MNYLKIHNDIISRAQLRASTRKEANLILGYSEQHHIVPKCMGGTNDKTNLVFLSAREHFVIHILLTKIYPQVGGLWFACNRLVQDKVQNRLNGKTYECLKRQISEYRKTQNKENNEVIAHAAKKISAALSGRTKETHSHIAAQANAIRGRTKDNDIGMAKSANKRRGRTKDTCQGVAKMAEKLKGRNKKNHEPVARMAESKRKIPIPIQMIIYQKRTFGVGCREIYNWVTNELKYDIHYSSISRIANKIKNDLSYYTSLATPV